VKSGIFGRFYFFEVLIFVFFWLGPTRTVARKSSIGGFAFVRGRFKFVQGGLDIKTSLKFP